MTLNSLFMVLLGINLLFCVCVWFQIPRELFRQIAEGKDQIAFAKYRRAMLITGVFLLIALASKLFCRLFGIE